MYEINKLQGYIVQHREDRRRFIITLNSVQWSSVQFSRSVMSDSLRPHESHARPPCPSPTPGVHSDSRPSSRDAIQPSHPLSSPAHIFTLSQHQDIFQWVSSSHQVAKVLELQHQSSSVYSGLISLRIDRFDLIAVQGTLKSLLQHHSLKASVLQCSAFSMVQLSYLCVTTGKAVL